MDDQLRKWAEDLHLSSGSSEEGSFTTKHEVNKPLERNNQLEVDYTDQFTTNMVFNCRENLIEWGRSTGQALGFVLTISSSRQGGLGRQPKLLIQRERSGEYCPSKPSSKLTGTKKCNCPFRLKGMKLKIDDDWILRVTCGVHNHPATTYMEGHSYAGRLSQDETSMLIDMSRSLVKPREILSTLKAKDPQNVSTL
ncbi:uncharacterized protein LOC120008680 [Tripterygium wilfordii]|uniref:uncharacterized protein LOC120008680 n=1 Tax=Tripterygium wilfordii TaxID=458696 RepID=UPI0018F82388|nr:uncharacterized protein LOC120008680 [Tripterygium wilfordii]